MHERLGPNSDDQHLTCMSSLPSLQQAVCSLQRHQDTSADHGPRGGLRLHNCCVQKNTQGCC